MAYPTRRYRTIWISDLHLGSKGAQTAHLLEFLKCHESDTLYLVGDIVDGWQLRKHGYWKRQNNDIIQKLLRKAQKGTDVVYIPGNHDEAAREYVGLDFGGIRLRRECEHRTADGRRLWILHGDEYDGVMQHAKWLAHLGDTLYQLAIVLNTQLNKIRAKFGKPYWSLSQYLKYKVKNAVSFITEFETLLADEAKKRGYDGVVCGHIHHAEIKHYDGIDYYNCGDWVESLTALVEQEDGRIELIDWSKIIQQTAACQENDDMKQAV